MTSARFTSVGGPLAATRTIIARQESPIPPTVAIVARNPRTLAGHTAGAFVRDLVLAEAVDPAIVRRVFRAAGAFIFGRQAGVRSL